MPPKQRSLEDNAKKRKTVSLCPSEGSLLDHSRTDMDMWILTVKDIQKYSQCLFSIVDMSHHDDVNMSSDQKNHVKASRGERSKSEWS
jgi:hypothetical protein